MKKRVTLRVDLVAAVGLEGVPEQTLVLGQHVAVALAKLLDEPNRTLNVGEEER